MSYLGQEWQLKPGKRNTSTGARSKTGGNSGLVSQGNRMDSQQYKERQSISKRNTRAEPGFSVDLVHTSDATENVWVETYDPSFKRSYIYKPGHGSGKKKSTWTRPQLSQWKAQLAELEKQENQNVITTGAIPIKEVSLKRSDSGSQTSSAASLKSVRFVESEGQRSINDSQWEEYVDPTYNHLYWYNPVTKESTWEKPDEIRFLEALPAPRRSPIAVSSQRESFTGSKESTSGSKQAVNATSTKELFPTGSAVLVCGLQFNQSLNGMQGIVMTSLKEKSRTIVQIGGKHLSLRNSNLVQADSSDAVSQETKQQKAPLVPSPINTKTLTGSSTPMTSSPSSFSCNSHSSGRRRQTSNPYKAFVKLVHWGVPRCAVEDQLRSEGLDPSVLNEMLLIEQPSEPADVVSSSSSSQLWSGEQTGEAPQPDGSQRNKNDTEVAVATEETVAEVAAIKENTAEVPPPRPPRQYRGNAHLSNSPVASSSLLAANSPFQSKNQKKDQHFMGMANPSKLLETTATGNDANSSLSVTRQDSSTSGNTPTHAEVLHNRSESRPNRVDFRSQEGQETLDGVLNRSVVSPRSARSNITEDRNSETMAQARDSEDFEEDKHRDASNETTLPQQGTECFVERNHAPPRRAMTSGSLEHTVTEQELPSLHTAFKLSLSQELGKVKLRKTASVGSGLDNPNRKSSNVNSTSSWLESLRTNPRFNAIRQASISRGDLETEED